MNQGKLEVVKEERARVKVNISRISKLKWTGMGEFNFFRFHIEVRIILFSLVQSLSHV